MSYRNAARLLLAFALLWPHAALAQSPTRGAGASNMQPPRKIKNVEPVYPESLQKEGVQGTVVIEATVGADGRVREAKVVQSIPQLDAAALAAVRQWEYEPAKFNGAPTAIVMTVRVAFALQPQRGGGPAQSNPPAPASTSAAPTGAPLSPQVQRDWDTTWQNVLKLQVDEKLTEAIALMEAFIRRNPNVRDAHALVSSMYEQRSDRTAAPAAKRRDLESAATHVTRAVALTTDPNMQFVFMWKLVRMYGPDQLNDSARAERYASDMVKQHPTRAEAHMVYAQFLREKGDIPRAAETIRQGRAQTELPLEGLLLAMQYPVEEVQHDRALSPEVTQARLQEALSAAEAILAMREKDERELRLATMGKAMVLELQAERVVRDKQQRIALLLESERWGAPMSEFRNGQPPPARRLSASETAQLEWEAVRRWNSRLADEGRIDAAVLSHREYLTTRAGFYPAHQELAELLIRSAEGARDPATRTAKFEQAAGELQRVLELAPAGSDRDQAFDRVLKLYGPTELNRPPQQEATARAMVKLTPTAPRPHYTLAAVLFRMGNATAAEDVLRAVRATIKPSAASRAGMASAIVGVLLYDEQLSTTSKRRLFDEASALLTEAEKLTGTREDVAVIEARMSWLNLGADRFEPDPARAAAQRAEAQRLSLRAITIRERQAPARR